MRGWDVWNKQHRGLQGLKLMKLEPFGSISAAEAPCKVTGAPAMLAWMVELGVSWYDRRGEE